MTAPVPTYSTLAPVDAERQRTDALLANLTRAMDALQREVDRIEDETFGVLN